MLNDNNQKSTALAVCRKRFTMAFAGLLLLMENVFYLVDTESINIGGVFNFDIVWQLYSVVFMACGIFVSSRSTSRRLLPGAFAVFTLLVCTLIASRQCQLLTGQSFMRGLMPQRGFILTLISFFVIYRMNGAGLIDLEGLLSFIIVAGSVGTLLYAAQAAAGGSFQFIHVAMNERYGGSRVYVDSALCVLSGLIAFWRLLKTGRVVYIFPFFLLFVYELYVSKGRLEFAAVLVALAACLLIARGKFDAKAIIVLMGFAAAVAFAASDYGGKVIQNYLVAGDDANNLIREFGKEYYFRQMARSPWTLLFGCGYPSTLYAPAAEAAGIGYGYYLVDNGIAAFAYVYGIVGVISVMYLWVRMSIGAVRILVRGGSGFYLLYVVMSLVMSGNIIFWWWQGAWMIVWPLLYCCIEREATASARPSPGRGLGSDRLPAFGKADR